MQLRVHCLHPGRRDRTDRVYSISIRRYADQTSTSMFRRPIQESKKPRKSSEQYAGAAELDWCGCTRPAQDLKSKMTWRILWFTLLLWKRRRINSCFILLFSPTFIMSKAVSESGFMRAAHYHIAALQIQSRMCHVRKCSIYDMRIGMGRNLGFDKNYLAGISIHHDEHDVSRGWSWQKDCPYDVQPLCTSFRIWHMLIKTSVVSRLVIWYYYYDPNLPLLHPFSSQQLHCIAYCESPNVGEHALHWPLWGIFFILLFLRSHETLCEAEADRLGQIQKGSM